MDTITFLKILMMRRDMSTKDLAIGLGVSSVKAKEWIDGERAIPIQRMDSLKKFLKIDNPELLSEKMKLPSEEELGLVEDKSVTNKIEIYKNRKVIWQPVGTTLHNFNKSVLDHNGNGSIFEKDLYPEVFKDFNGVEKLDRGLSVWGVKDGKNLITLNRFHRISTGDLVMFYFAQKFIAFGEVVHKIENREFAMNVWGNADYKNLLVLDNVKSIDVDFKEVTNELYGKSSNSLQGMRILDEKKSSEIMKYLNVT